MALDSQSTAKQKKLQRHSRSAKQIGRSVVSRCLPEQAGLEPA